MMAKNLNFFFVSDESSFRLIYLYSLLIIYYYSTKIIYNYYFHALERFPSQI